MKLRLRQNSLRLRLLRGEVDRLARGETIKETIVFGMESKLSYALSATATAVIHASFRDSSIAVEFPAAVARQFLESDLVSVQHQQSVQPGGGTLTILIEKDFVCTDRENDPDHFDAFQRPSKSCE